MCKVAPVSPGEMLDEEFLKHLGMTKYRLAKEIGVPRNASATSSPANAALPQTPICACAVFSA